MTSDLNFAGAAAEHLADAIEAAASRDMYAAAPPGLRLSSRVVAGATALLAPTIPVSYFNRVIGLGNDAPATSDDIERTIALFAQAKVASYWLHLVPSARPHDLAAQLEQRGFALAKRRSWAKFLRATREPPPTRTHLQVRTATAADAEAIGKVICSAYDMPPSIGPWFAALVGRPKWQVVVAEDAGRIVATGALFVDGDHGWLGAGATLAESRGAGAQSSLLALRVALAGDLGCKVVATETGEAIQNEPNPSLANIRRTGFVQVCSRLNFAAPSRPAG
jgi:hypothetical protein